MTSSNNNNNSNSKKLNILMIGTGEYTTGYVGASKDADAPASDKSAGVVALTVFDMRRRGKVGTVGLCGVNGTKLPQVRDHMVKMIGPDVYKDMDLTCTTYPADDVVDPKAYETALLDFSPGDVAIVFTPDDTHFDIAMACVQRGLHVMVTKPIVQTLDHHQRLSAAARAHNVLVAVEVHKRLDPFYADARDRARQSLGDVSYVSAYMSQPKHQLDTFRAWAGKSSDISYYLNSHHVDWTEWTLHGQARPVRVTATASTGVAQSRGLPTEDSITLTVQWENLPSRTLGCAVYTSSWIAPPSDVHSQQRFFYMGTGGEIRVDQAHRGCTVATDEAGFASVNPLFMKYTPTNGYFGGQQAYGVRSIESFADACTRVVEGATTPSDYDDGSLATVHTTLQGTAILQAGRMSLDRDGRPMDIQYEASSLFEPVGIVPHIFADEK